MRKSVSATKNKTKKLYLIGGPMGVGKTTAGQLLKIRLDNCVFLDGDWCWDMEPFQVTTETKKMVIENICFLLNNFIRCPAYENIIFSWVMQEQMIVDNIISRLNTENCSIIKLSLICTEKTLQERLEKDVADGVRKSDVIPRGLAYLPLYSKVGSVKIDTSEKTPEEIVEEIINVSDNG